MVGSRGSTLRWCPRYLGDIDFTASSIPSSQYPNLVAAGYESEPQNTKVWKHVLLTLVSLFGIV